MDAIECLRISNELAGKRASFDGLWAQFRRFIYPKGAGDLNPENAADINIWRHSETARKAMLKLASAIQAYITPVNQRWMTLKPYNVVMSSSLLSEWYSKCTEVYENELAISNFYSSAHLAYIDRCLFGTGCMFCNHTLEGGVTFEHIPCGTYAIADGMDGTVDMIARWKTMTAHQAVMEFGLDNVGEKVSKSYGDIKKRHTDKFKFMQLVMPNKSAKGSGYMVVGPDRPFTNIWVCEEDKKIVMEDGYYEFPFMVTRFLPWGDGSMPYGYAPAFDILDSIKEEINVRKLIFQSGHVRIFPRLFTTADMVGEVDLRAGGQTILTEDAIREQLPREWGTNSDYAMGLDYLARIEQSIEDAYHIDMLETISRVDREMTATEVQARENEKILSFTPSFTLFVSDFRPMAYRIFSVLYRAGKFEMPPAEAFDGQDKLKVPKIEFNGKMAQALQRMQSSGLMNALQALGGIAEIMQDPTLISKFIKPYEAVSFIWEACGAPTQCKISEMDYNTMKKKEEAQMDEQFRAMQTEQESVSNRNNAQAVNLLNKK